MLNALYIGDELTATGFRLVGLDVKPVPADVEALWALIQRERLSRQLIVLSESAAGPVRERIDLLLESEPLPPIVVLPENPDYVDHSVLQARQTLGIEALKP